MIPPGLTAGAGAVAPAVCVVVLLVVLAQKEAFRAYSRNRSSARYLNAAAAPLVIVALASFAVTVNGMLS